MTYADIFFDAPVPDGDLQRAYAHALGLGAEEVRVIREPGDLPPLGVVGAVVMAVAVRGDCKLRASIIYVPDGSDVTDEGLGQALADALGCGVYVPSDGLDFREFSRFRPGMGCDAVAVDVDDEADGEETTTVKPYTSLLGDPLDAAPGLN